jgi:hypothetical protein
MTTITTTPDGLGGAFVHAGPVRLGHVFPRQTLGWPNPRPIPGCAWFGRRVGGKARPFPDRDAAHDYVAAAHILEENL